jgi:hypothetical protein
VVDVVELCFLLDDGMNKLILPLHPQDMMYIWLSIIIVTKFQRLLASTQFFFNFAKEARPQF